MMLLALAFSSSAATLNVYISSPGTQSTFVSGATTETFDELDAGNRSVDYYSAIGTYNLTDSARFNVQDANQYGGADETKYMAFGAQSSSAGVIDLDLNGVYSYFGFWWSAGDVNNGLSFYYNEQLLARFTTADITQLLAPATGPNVTAVNGTSYAKSAYFGNPNSGANGGEAYAYVHVIANGTLFNRILFDNSGTTGTGFESDNHSVVAGHVTPDGESVLVREVPSTDVATPEPGSMLMIGTGLLAVSVCLRRRVDSSRK
jgi:hypothetical protein